MSIDTTPTSIAFTILVDAHIVLDNSLLCFSSTDITSVTSTDITNIASENKLQVWITNNVSFLYSATLVSEILELGDCILVSDGSHFPINPLITSAALLLIYNRKVIYRADFISKVRPHLRNSYIAELCGVLSFLLLLEHLIYKYSTKLISITIATDCAAILDLLIQ